MIVIPRLVISALRGGAGKSLLTLGLARALVQDGVCLKAFKKGPDYIDAAWLSLAARRPASNLDPFFLPPERLRALFAHALTSCQGMQTADFALIEGNRGLFDGRDLEGSCSTAELARIVQSPILLSLDCTKMTRTAAAVLGGLLAFEKDVHIAGVVLNKLGSERHASLVRSAIEHYCSVPVFGALPRMPKNPLPERHMGLALHAGEEAGQEAAHALLDELAAYLRKHLDIGSIVQVAQAAPSLPDCAPLWPEPRPPAFAVRPRIGYVCDAALWFYYQENLEALEKAGAELVRLSLLDSQPWPQLDALYLGGGFPEDFCAELGATRKLELLREYAELGMPIYAECGGMLLLVRGLERQGRNYPMAGIFPLQAHFYAQPQGLGYTEATVVRDNPFHPQGSRLRGHEFHYTRCVAEKVVPDLPYALRLDCGAGLIPGLSPGLDGLSYKAVFASYMHIFAPAVPHWARRFIEAAASFAASRL